MPHFKQVWTFFLIASTDERVGKKHGLTSRVLEGFFFFFWLCFVCFVFVVVFSGLFLGFFVFLFFASSSFFDTLT